MDQTINISVPIPRDNEGMIGRECPECEHYFKLNPGTGLPTDHCHCPYCDYEGSSDTFLTHAQLEYVRSIAMNHAYDTTIIPAIDGLLEPLRKLEKRTRNSGSLRITVNTPTIRRSPYPVRYFSEKDLETKLTCENCGLFFSVYGVFARCPDCKGYNAFQIYQKSLELLSKQLALLTAAEIPADVKEHSASQVLCSCISTFDGLGKELRLRRPDKYPDRPKNLFQNLYALNEALNKVIQRKHSDFEFLSKMFQVRHVFEHNMGVVDDDFVQKLPIFSTMKGRKYPLKQDDVQQFIASMLELGAIIEKHFKT